MQDLLLWRMLRERRYTAEAIVPLLHDLASTPLNERLAFLGLLNGPLLHPDAAVRAAAVTALGEARGRLALQRLVAALNDGEPSVRLAAVEALRRSVHGEDWARWAHVLFHPDPAVRQAGIAPGRPFPPPLLHLLFLLPDPVCRESVQQQLNDAVLTVDNLPMLFDYVKRGLLEGPLARRLAGRLTWDDWLNFLSPTLPRTSDLTSSMDKALAPDWPEQLAGNYTADPLDDIFHLFWETDLPQQPGAASPSERFFGMLLEGCLAQDELFRQWVAFTLLTVAAQHRSWPPLAAVVCAVCEPRFFRCLWIPRAVRRAAVAGLYRLGERCPRRQDREVRDLIDAAVCRHTDGRLDLWAIGGLLHLLPSNPYQFLLQWVGLGPIVAAFQADEAASLPFLCLNDRSSKGRKHLIRELSIQARTERPRLLALLARTVPSDSLDFLDGLDGATAVQVFEQLLRTEPPPPARGLSEHKTRCLADRLLPKITAGQVGPFLRSWLKEAAPENSRLGLMLLARLARVQDARFLLQAVRVLDVDLLLAFLAVLPFCPGFPYDVDLRLARELTTHADDGVRFWAEQQLRQLGAWAAGRPSLPAAVELPEPLQLGLCARLRQQPDPEAPNLEYCLALLASHDPVSEVDVQFSRFSSPAPDFLQRLEEEMVANWSGEMRLALLGHAWLYRWDYHATAFVEQLSIAWPDGLASALRGVARLTSPILRQRVWLAVGRVMEVWRWHAPDRLAAVRNEALGQVLVDALTTAQGEVAAGLLMQWHAAVPSSEVLQALRPSIMARLPQVAESIRQLFVPWIDAQGLPAAPSAAPAAADPVPELPSRLWTTDDLDFLAACAGERTDDLGWIALQRLLLQGEAGVQRLTALLQQAPPPAALLALTGTITDWPEGAALEEVRRLVRSSEALPEVRFRIGSALHRRGDTKILPHLLDAVCQSGPVGWFDWNDWSWLRSVCPSTSDLAVRLVLAEHPNAYGAAVEVLTEADAGASAEAKLALLAFLDRGTGRMRSYRLQAAAWLFHNHGETAAILPLLLQGEPATPPPLPTLLAELPEDLVQAAVTGLLMAGLGETAEEMLLALLGAAGVDPFSREEAYGRLLSLAESASVRRQTRKQMRPSLGRARKVRRVAETFAWGVRIGRELTGKLYTLQMIASEQLGYTRLRENKLFISPMPILRGEMHGREVVRALILHEYGHHLYHRGEEAEQVWEQSEREELQRLLNLVSDEHLERNLRSLDRDFGDQLKLLAAYAFQHTNREFEVEGLLTTLQGRAFEVLSATPLGVARRRGCVLVANGRILLEMERAGFSFARFMRALRMGLGNRHNDPKVAEALELFKGGFRKSDMPTLLEKARELRRIFGKETNLLNSFSQDDSLGVDDEELADASEDLDNDEVQKVVRDVLQTGSRKDAGMGGEGVGGRGLNLSPNEDFEPITRVVPIPYDPARHGVYAAQVARPAQKMRRFFQDLGLAMKPQRFRLHGKSFDKTRARAVVLRGDPRMLIARELRRLTDLFLGVVIDCSGSMSSQGNIEKAKLFGALLAEATRDHPGIDLRLYGFTDQVIYDAGNANRCAAHGLEAGGGNNDAAALWHAAQAARASRRRARLLVMISDGSPTECSVAALTALVERLTRRMKIHCAQVAVCPLDHICFPHYILLDSDNQEESVRRFGVVMTRLVGQALRGG